MEDFVPVTLPSMANVPKVKSATYLRWEERHHDGHLPDPNARQSVVVDVTGNGYGDSIVAAWIAEGTKGKNPSLVIHSREPTRAALLDMLSQKVVDKAPTNHISRTFKVDQGMRGHPSRIITWCLVMGIHPQWKRPPHNITEDELSAAPAYDVLLLTRSNQREREWTHWDELEAMLQGEGLTTFRPSTTWRPTAAMMLRTKLVIGNDSAPAHLSGTLDVPTIALLGPTTPSVFAHLQSVHCLQTEKRELMCSGCWYSVGFEPQVCRHECASLAKLPASKVFVKAKGLLS